ncbi:hypothetical protein CDAR_541981 [Caerostris darwini]|uniref:Uncharacterized protein n=1 Tax=Caerostris darwini TaxID=1538125 RepID=A0AAV4UUM6_9ARAC|nr:hypothetical protein CDAR_541981 [Caerostris darwini]
MQAAREVLFPKSYSPSCQGQLLHSKKFMFSTLTDVSGTLGDRTEVHQTGEGHGQHVRYLTNGRIRKKKWDVFKNIDGQRNFYFPGSSPIDFIIAAYQYRDRLLLH